MTSLSDIKVVHKRLAAHVPSLSARELGLLIDLARHAALPAALSAELVHILRINFVEEAPYYAEAALLLSPLCHELGDGIYEMDSSVRNLLLRELTVEHTSARVRDVARLLKSVQPSLPALGKLSWP